MLMLHTVCVDSLVRAYHRLTCVVFYPLYSLFVCLCVWRDIAMMSHYQKNCFVTVLCVSTCCSIMMEYVLSLTCWAFVDCLYTILFWPFLQW